MEIWKDIKGLEGKYQVSDLGEVKVLAFTGIRKDGRKYHVVENIKKQSIFNNGYYGFSTTRSHGTILLHRALAEAFIPNPENKRCVNHKDGNKLNNSLDNLEWATHGENNQHAYDTGLKKA
ncbi:MAG TPA: NUMOD4 domain-containing protein, partial [Flavobacterium sp.]|nr:NUMOD4 domain-containing protein [Flavobacterium sp.]